MTRPARVVVEGLSKDYGSVKAVAELSFSVAAGEIVGLLGPNGAGKTTALHLILGILEPTAGAVSVLGLSPFSDRYRVYPRINFSSAYVQLPFNLTVERNLRVFADLYGVDRAAERVAALLRSFGIESFAKRPTGALSSGEQTRLNLCKSLLNDPEVLFLDEPTASLDPDMAEGVRSSLKRIQREKGVSMVYTSHNMAEVETLCDRVVFLHRGRKMAEGTPAELKERFGRRTLEGVFLKISRGEP